MRHQAECARNGWRKLFLAAVVAALALLVGVGLMAVPGLRAQAPSAQPPVVPQWQIDAGGKMSFDAASVKRNKSGSPLSGGPRSRSNVPLYSTDEYSPTGGYFSATNIPLQIYIDFAYKLGPFQDATLRHQLAAWKWAASDQFDIEARAQGNPTKDQLRLMMQDLLANRFKLIVHFETKQLLLFDIVPLKVGQGEPQ